jgi:hypothetical protein
MKEKMIGFFSFSTGDIHVIFRPYIYTENGIATFIDRYLKDNYGTGLNLILFSWICYEPGSVITPLFRRVRYRKSEGSVEVKVNVTYENFFGKSEEERRLFVVESIEIGLSLVRDKLRWKKEIDFDFDLLAKDFQQIGTRYMETISDQL